MFMVVFQPKGLLVTIATKYWVPTFILVGTCLASYDCSKQAFAISANEVRFGIWVLTT